MHDRARGADPASDGAAALTSRDTSLPSPAAPGWKERLYDAYVSSGQAAPRPEAGATPDDILAPFRPHVTQFIERHIPADRNVHIVDLGCGDGIVLHFLERAGYHHTLGIDVSAEQVARARRLGLSHVVQGRISDYFDTAADASVDVLLLMDVLEHLTPDELFATLDEVVRVLRPGGRCLAHLPNAEGLFGMRIRYGDFTHELAFTARSATQVFRTVGFTRVECFEDRPVVHGPVSFARRVLWTVGTLPTRLLLAAETGETDFILSQTLLVRATR